jgi:hypothetical protein
VDQSPVIPPKGGILLGLSRSNSLQPRADTGFHRYDGGFAESIHNDNDGVVR